MRFVLRIVVVIYGVCCLAALGWLLWRGSGWFGASDPLSAVYAITLAMPWTLLLDRVPGGFPIKFAAIAVAMALNFGIARLLTRRPRYRR